MKNDPGETDDHPEDIETFLEETLDDPDEDDE